MSTVVPGTLATRCSSLYIACCPLASLSGLPVITSNRLGLPGSGLPLGSSASTAKDAQFQ